jgi:23S rRNA (cytidine1920-2'-O)/16S rRNA (cytidine1409-2'-O)-methyltransferase
VGYGQIHWKLRNDPRVRILEKTNIRYTEPEDLEECLEGAVIDVSFISLRLVVPQVSKLLKREAFIIALIKPQFEVSKGEVGKGGVVKNPALHREVNNRMKASFEASGWAVQGLIPSPLTGPKGNREFLVYMTRGR